MIPLPIHPGNIRPATEKDAEDIARVHHSAVHGLPSPSHPQDVLDAWSPEPGEVRFQQFRRAIGEGKELFLVAEAPSGIVGFGSIVPTLNELRALYVDAQVAHQGVGSAILVELEALAVSAGCSELQMHASVNAEGFYKRYGYVSRERGMHKLAGGLEMPYVQMSKSLSLRLDT